MRAVTIGATKLLAVQPSPRHGLPSDEDVDSITSSLSHASITSLPPEKRGDPVAEQKEETEGTAGAREDGSDLPDHEESSDVEVG